MDQFSRFLCEGLSGRHHQRPRQLPLDDLSLQLQSRLMETQLFLPLLSLHLFSILQELVLVLFLLFGDVKLHNIFRFFQIFEQTLHLTVVLLPFVKRRFHALTDHPVNRPHRLPLRRFHFF